MGAVNTEAEVDAPCLSPGAKPGPGAATRLSVFNRNMVAGVPHADPLAELRAIARAADNEGLAAVAAEALALAAYHEANLIHVEEALELLGQARARASVSGDGAAHALVQALQCGVWTRPGKLEHGLRLARQLLRSPAFGRVGLLHRIRTLADLAVAFTQLSRYDVVVEVLEAALAAAAEGAPELLIRLRFTCVSVGVMAAVRRHPEFDAHAAALGPETTDAARLVELARDALAALPAQNAVLQRFYGETGPAFLGLVARVFAACGVGPTAPGAGHAADLWRLAPSRRDALLLRQWESCALLLEGQPRLALDVMQRSRQQHPWPEGGPDTEGSFVEARAWARLGHPAKALACYEDHVKAQRLHKEHHLSLSSDDWRVRPDEGKGAEAAIDPAWPEALQRVVMLIHRRGGVELEPDVLATEAGKSDRWLRMAFQQHLGQSPRAYSTRVRLQVAHSRLTAGWLPPGGLQELAQLAGFTNPSRFAQAYAAQYGEKPRATLQRSLQRVGN